MYLTRKMVENLARHENTGEVLPENHHCKELLHIEALSLWTLKQCRRAALCVCGRGHDTGTSCPLELA